MEIAKNYIKQAREQVHIGQYDEAILLYDQGIDSIKQICLQGDLKHQGWGELKIIIENEKNEIKDLSNFLTNDNIQLEKIQQKQDTKPEQKVIINKPEIKQIPIKPNPVNIRHNQHNNRPNQNKTVQNSNRTANNRPNPVNNLKPKQANNKPEEKKKTFLQHIYPNGKGPDYDLIDGLEKEMVIKNLNISFDDIAELEDAKQALTEAVLWPLKMPEIYVGNLKPWKGVLLYGPPGTGKTMLAKAIASTGETTFFNISAANLASKWLGEAEKLVRLLFEMARFYQPSTIFFDEIDAIVGARREGEHESSRKVKTELLQQIDGFQSIQEGGKSQSVTIIAATNIPWGLDNAMLRRLEKRIYIPLPGIEGIKRMYEINLKNVSLDQNINWNNIYQKSLMYSGADIATVIKDACFIPVREIMLRNKNQYSKEAQNEIKNISLSEQCFLQAIQNNPKSVKEADLVKYQDWINDLQQ